MPFIRCTQKLLKELKIKEFEESTGECVLGNWYANLIEISGGRGVLFTNEKTLFSFLASDESFLGTGFQKTFITRLNYVLVEEGFDPGWVLDVCKEYRSAMFAKTASRSILSVMNEIYRMFEVQVSLGGGFERCDMSRITQKVNKAPQNKLECRSPLDILWDLLGQ